MMANRFHGSYRDSLGPRQQRANKSSLPRGAARMVRASKLLEAEVRNAQTLPEHRRRQFRLEVEAQEFKCSVKARARRQRQLSRMNRGL